MEARLVGAKVVKVDPKLVKGGGGGPWSVDGGGGVNGGTPSIGNICHSVS